MTNADSNDNSGVEQSFRFLVTPTVGGTEERVRFSNFFGTTPVTIGAARIAVGQDGSASIDVAHDAALTFGGATEVTIAPGGIILSDPVMVSYGFGQALAVSLYLKGAFRQVSRHDSFFIKNFRTAMNSGDKTSDSSGESFVESLGDWLLVSGVDVYGPYQGTIALFGSSTTDGFKSDYGSTNAYPVPNGPVAGQHTSRLSDWLARRLNTAGYQIGVVNAGVPGDTVTVDSTNTTGDVQNANDRIARDVLALPNLLGMVTYFGSIDLRSSDCKSAPAIEDATETMIATASAAHVPVLLATIPPSAFCTNPAQANFGPTPTPSDPYAGGLVPGPANGGELQRNAFNAWVRSTGIGLKGVAGVADFDAALTDPAHPDFLMPTLNSGDNYHPNGAGYHAESDVIPYTLLLPDSTHSLDLRFRGPRSQ